MMKSISTEINLILKEYAIIQTETKTSFTNIKIERKNFRK